MQLSALWDCTCIPYSFYANVAIIPIPPPTSLSFFMQYAADPLSVRGINLYNSIKEQS